MRQPMYVRANWYTGDVTIERVISEDDTYYNFDPSLNGSCYWFKEYCTKLTAEELERHFGIPNLENCTIKKVGKCIQ